MKLLTALFFSLAFLASAQTSNYSATTGDVSLSAAATAFTIQQPASNARQVQLQSALVFCSVSCNVTQSQDGTAATSTAGTANPLLPTTRPATATVWTASNVGAGTAAGGILHLAAAQWVVIDLSQISLGTGGTGTNYTVAISSITGTANITLFWSER